jgi:hypothetical protein
MKALTSKVFLYVIVFGAALALYWLTLAPDLVWQDQGDYQYQAAKCVLNIPGDVVRVHPLYIVFAHWLGSLGIFNYAYAANLASAIFGAATVANIFLLVWLLVRKTWPAILACGIYAFSHSAWFIGVQAQTYSMTTAAISLGLILAVSYIQTGKVSRLLAMGFVFGLGLSVHMMSQVAFAVIMVWLLAECVQKKIKFINYLGIILFWAVGAGLLWYVMWIEYQRSGDMMGTILSAIYGRWGNAVFNMEKMGVLIKKSVQFFVLNFPTPLVILAIPGIWLSFKRLDKKPIAGLLASITVLYMLFATRYNVPNQNFFFLPMYLLVSVYIGLGFAFVCEKSSAVMIIATGLLLITIPPTYYAISKTAESRKVNLGNAFEIPYRNVYEYYLRPWQNGQTGPRRLLTDVFAALPQGAVLMVDSTPYSVFQCGQEVEGQRQDLQVIDSLELNDKIKAAIAEKKRIFTLYDYPQVAKWIEKKESIKGFPISGSENIYEINYTISN